MTGTAHVASDKLRGGALWPVWFGVVTAGEFLGFAVPAFTGAVTAHATYPAMLAAGRSVARSACAGSSRRA